jgi:hypothetical protein
MRAAAIVCLILMIAVSVPAQAADVAAGIKQVQEGDFEGAIGTLAAAAAELQTRPERLRDLVQAYVYLGVAHVALDQAPEARRAFGEAAARDPKLRLSPQSFSPKVIAAFEEARRAVAPPPRKGGARTGWLLGGAAAGAATAAVILSRGDDAADAPVIANARMATPVIECPDESDQRPITFAVTVDARNPANVPLAIQSVTVVATIVSSPAIPSEVDTVSNNPATTIPMAVPARTNTTVRVESFLLCGNGPGGPSRFNEWSVRVTLATSAGVFVLDSADRLHVTIP